MPKEESAFQLMPDVGPFYIIWDIICLELVGAVEKTMCPREDV